MTSLFRMWMKNVTLSVKEEFESKNLPKSDKGVQCTLYLFTEHKTDPIQRRSEGFIGARGEVQFCRPKCREMPAAHLSPPFLPLSPHFAALLGCRPGRSTPALPSLRQWVRTNLSGKRRIRYFWQRYKEDETNCYIG